MGKIRKIVAKTWRINVGKRIRGQQMEERGNRLEKAIDKKGEFVRNPLAT